MVCLSFVCFFLLTEHLDVFLRPYCQSLLLSYQLTHLQDRL